MPKTFQPQVLTANDLVEGDSVFYGTAGWTRRIAEARVAETPEQAQVLEDAGRLAEADNQVVGPYLVTVALEAGAPVPVSRRERIRADREPTFAYAAPARVARAA